MKYKYPTRGNNFSRFLSKLLLKLMGWKITGKLPDIPKFVITAAPHTSNMDFLITLLGSFCIGVRMSLMVKASLMRIPVLKYLIKWLGGIPVERDNASGVVGQSVEAFRNSAKLILAITPEGTRSNVATWKSGFYHIAVSANVPIVPVYIDYGNKVLGVAPEFKITGQKETDIAKMKKFYSQFKGRNA